MISIAIDLDDTIYPFSQALYTELVVHWDYQGTYEQFWLEDANKKGYNSLWWENMIRIESVYSVMIPLREDLELLKEIGRHYSIYYLTARPKEVEFTTRSYLNKYEYPQVENLTFIGKHQKGVVCNSLGITIAFEDMVKHIKSLQECGVDTYIMNQLWNREQEGKRIYSVQHLGGVLL